MVYDNGWGDVYCILIYTFSSASRKKRKINNSLHYIKSKSQVAGDQSKKFIYSLILDLIQYLELGRGDNISNGEWSQSEETNLQKALD